jgi:hypothetical protein
LKRPTGKSKTYRGRTIVELDDRAVVAGQVARADPRTDADAIPDAQRREPVARVDRVEQLPARVDRRRDRAEMIVEFALGDRVKQRALRWRSRLRRCRPAPWRAIGHSGRVAMRPDGPAAS